MHYDDFIFFMLSEEDKGNRASLQYFFTCVDIDGDDVITPSDMRYFYDVQTAVRACWCVRVRAGVRVGVRARRPCDHAVRHALLL